MEERTIKFDNLILEKILDIASQMLMSGAEVFRVEKTVRYLCRAYGALYTDVFVITSSIVVTVRFKSGEPMTQTRRVSSIKNDFKRLSALNDLSRRICQRLMSEDEIERELLSLDSDKANIALRLVMWALVSASFTLFFGGSCTDAVFSSMIGVLLCLSNSILSKVLKNPYLIIISCSIIGGVLSQIPQMFIQGTSSFYISIGNIMLLIPGITFTTSLRDMFIGDTISGLLRLAEAVLVSLIIAWGFALPSATAEIISAPSSPLLQLFVALSGSFGFAYVFNCRLKNGAYSAAIAFLGWGVYLISSHFGLGEYYSFFLASVFITLSAEVMARINRCPATVFLVIGTIPLIPGKMLYSTMRYALDGNFEFFSDRGVATLMYAVSIAAGVVAASAVVSIISDIKEKKIMK